MKNKLIVISGPSGVGKGTVLKEVLKRQDNIEFSISCTTRKPRVGEVNGVNYFFISREDFKKSVQNGEFLEWAEFSGNFYGTKKTVVENELKDKNVLLEIDTQGALQVKEKMPDCIMIFIAPPSVEELEKRLRGRNTESEEAILKRLNFVEFEIENSKKFDYVVVNDTVDDTVNKLLEIIDA